MDSGFDSAGTGRRVRPVLFFHNPKTGGSSLNVTFQRCFGSRNAGIFTDVETPKEANRIIMSGSAGRQVLLVSGHISPMLVPAANHVVTATIVRNPIEHVISYFCYSYKTRYRYPWHLEHMQSCAGYDEGRFSAADVERWVANKLGKNPQTQFLSGARIADATAFQRARDAIDKCDVVGRTEAIHSFLRMLGHKAGLNIHRSWHANTSPHDIIDDAQEDLHRRLRPYLEYDANIYAQVAERHALSSDWQSMEQCAPIPIEAFRATLKERITSFYKASRVERSQRIRGNLERLRNWVGEFSTSSA